tara:strand:+ start:361 stop:600 length:240 start_codon:yes stop_codon:yes gene_type:complete
MKKNKISNLRIIEKEVDETKRNIEKLDRQIAYNNNLLFSIKIFGMDNRDISKTIGKVFDLKKQLTKEKEKYSILLGEET